MYTEKKTTATLKSEQTSIATVRNHLRASLPTPLIFHYLLPLTSEAGRFSEKAVPPPSLERAKLFTAPPLFVLLAIWKQIANGAHSSVMEALYSLHTAVGNDAMNKFGTCWQWRYERSPILATEQLILCAFGKCSWDIYLHGLKNRFLTNDGHRRTGLHTKSVAHWSS